jgi:hypothetical protein
MRRRGQIDDDQYRVAIRIRAAWKVINGSGRSSVDLARERAALPTGSPVPARLAAIDVVDRTQKTIGPMGHGVILSIVVMGLTVTETAKAMPMFHGKPSAKDREFVGRLFRIALSELVEEFGGEGTT